MAKIAISQHPGIRYPDFEDLGPAEPYPELSVAAGRSRQNEVYALVRRCLREFGCDSERFGTAMWNPLGAWIKRGQRVFILPNFVTHRQEGESKEAFEGKCTHASIVRAVIDYAVLAAGDPTLVSFGNAPIQSCEFERVVRDTGADKIRHFYASHGNAGIGPHDLRLVVSRWTRFRAMTEKRFVNPQDAVRIDLGTDSLLEEHYQNGSRVEFRISDYPFEDTAAHHARGRHIYVLNRRVLDSDVIISVPKLKTHERVGITCALKGTVGSIGMKECLAHHRSGSPERGGDEYPRSTLLRDFSSFLSDKADSGGTDLRSNMLRVGSKVLNKLLRTGSRGIMLGMWHGNDTAWRMSLDIARILRFASRDGRFSETPTRTHLALVDGIVGGEGSGPLHPSPHPTGALLFGDDIASVDATCALVMGFDPRAISLIARAFGQRYALSDFTLHDLTVMLDGAPFDPWQLPERFGPPYKPAKGWIGHIEARSTRDGSLPVRSML